MPATFVHCLIAQQAIDNLLKESGGHPYTGKLGVHNNFAITGATGPDYPYLTDLILYGILHFGHNWSDRMHYENTDIFVRKGVVNLSRMDKGSEDFFKCLAWFCGYVSHIVVDSFVHPTINTAVGGIYLFTHNDHRICEMVQDVYIFQKKTEEEIIQANPGTGTFGYLRILDECSDPADPKRQRFYPAVKVFWTELLKEAHPHAADYFKDIDPDTWHKNYKSRVNFITNPGPIFRHVLKQGEINYKTTAGITADERRKYIEQVPLPDGTVSHYDQVFDRAVGKVMDVWKKIFPDVESGNEPDVSSYIMDWNLDTGVDQNKIFYW
jgi:hypothetical protein